MRYLMTFSYDGTNYNGFQKQLNKNTIQDVIESKLSQLDSLRKVNLCASGRTDAGVHAIAQKAHFDLVNEIPVDRIKNSLNEMLPKDIYIKDVEVVDDEFHARFNSKKKKYMYKINVGEYNPLEVNYVYQYNKKLDISKMEEAIKYFLGEHDFRSYTKMSDEKESYVRTIYKIDILQKDDYVYITFIGNGFLRYMVRNMVGSLIEVGSNKLLPTNVKQILGSKDRTKAGITAPSCGLYLMEVEYEK